MSKLSHSNEESMNTIDEKRAARDGIEISPVTQEMVDRFLAWPLPVGFSPDCGIKFDGSGVPPNDYKDVAGYVRTWPIGTNLFSADQAKEMLEHAICSDSSVEKEFGRLRIAAQKALTALEDICASTLPYREDGSPTISDKSIELVNEAIEDLCEKLGVKSRIDRALSATPYKVPGEIGEMLDKLTIRKTES